MEDWDDLIEAFEQEKQFKGNILVSVQKDITLKSALTIQRHITMEMNGHTFSVSKDFDWKGGDAVFTTTNDDDQGEFFISNGTINGPTEGTFEGKYIFNQSSSKNTTIGDYPR